MTAAVKDNDITQLLVDLFKQMQRDIKDQGEKTAAIHATLISVGSDVKSFGGQLSSAQERIGKMEALNDVQDEKIKTLETINHTQTTTLKTLKDEVNDLKAQVKYLLLLAAFAGGIVGSGLTMLAQFGLENWIP